MAKKFKFVDGTVNPKEAVYDSQIHPLMAQIIETCKKHKISFVCDFALGQDEFGVELHCTTGIVDKACDSPLVHYETLRRLCGKPEFMAFTITTPAPTATPASTPPPPPTNE